MFSINVKNTGGLGVNLISVSLVEARGPRFMVSDPA
jgi:hypothetical protein